MTNDINLSTKLYSQVKECSRWNQHGQTKYGRFQPEPPEPSLRGITPEERGHEVCKFQGKQSRISTHHQNDKSPPFSPLMTILT